jgi:proline iminopeptidase
MDTGGDQRWVVQNIPEILKKRGYSPAAVEAARRFYNGQITAGEFLSVSMKFMKAYYYHFSLLTLAHDAFFRPHVKFRPEAAIFGCTQLLKGWTMMDRLGEIHVPTLVMAGRFDFLFPTEHEAALAAGIPGARLEIIECAGHNPQDENNAAVIAAIKSFMSIYQISKNQAKT